MPPTHYKKRFKPGTLVRIRPVWFGTHLEDIYGSIIGKKEMVPDKDKSFYESYWKVFSYYHMDIVEVPEYYITKAKKKDNNETRQQEEHNE